MILSHCLENPLSNSWVRTTVCSSICIYHSSAWYINLHKRHTYIVHNRIISIVLKRDNITIRQITKQHFIQQTYVIDKSLLKVAYAVTKYGSFRTMMIISNLSIDDLYPQQCRLKKMNQISKAKIFLVIHVIESLDKNQ